ncbi:MAG TPA: metallophosphoesterase [Phycisphaerae bacterium]|nr:metallophosphoesterase [Phycisphaerae bacterium]
MTTPRFRPQFDPATLSKSRRFERMFLVNLRVNKCISNIGKAVLTCMIWPRFVAPFRWEFSRKPLPLGWPNGGGKPFAGYKILQLSDLHVGRVRPDYLAGVFTRCLEEKPDLIVITGDLIDYDIGNIEILERLLQPLLAANVPDGILAIFGNHDYHEYSWRHNGKRSASRSIQKRLVKLLHRLNIRLLRNESHRISRGGADLVVVGLDEMWTDRADAPKAFDGLLPTDAILCLQHNPDGVEFLRSHPWQYMLCGHSHGGQANFPFLGPMYVPMKHRQYLHGLFDFPALPSQPIDRRHMYVSRGLGYSHPIRLRCQPEATLFTVVEA